MKNIVKLFHPRHFFVATYAYISEEEYFQVRNRYRTMVLHNS